MPHFLVWNYSEQLNSLTEWNAPFPQSVDHFMLFMDLAGRGGGGGRGEACVKEQQHLVHSTDVSTSYIF